MTNEKYGSGRKRRRPASESLSGSRSNNATTLSMTSVALALMGAIASQDAALAFSPSPSFSTTTSTFRSSSSVTTRSRRNGSTFLMTAATEISEETCLEQEVSLVLTAAGQEDQPTSSVWLANEEEQQQQEDLPPWLQRYYEPSLYAAKGLIPSQKLQELKDTLQISGFTTQDIQEILQTMLHYASSDRSSKHNQQPRRQQQPQQFLDPSLLAGMIDFVQLILAEHSHFVTNDESNAAETSPTTSNKHKLHCDIFATKPVLLAGIVHYAESVAARQGGIYNWLGGSNSLGTKASIGKQHLKHQLKAVDATKKPAFALLGSFEDGLESGSLTSKVLTADMQVVTETKNAEVEPQLYPSTLSPKAKKIAQSAATIKRAEVLASTLLGVGQSRRLSKVEAEGLRGLLLSSMDDWRALALRCIASLFRLEGILENQHRQLEEAQDGEVANKDGYTPLLPGLRSPDVVHTAQEAILVYATLAERLGMHQLKAKIEERAFQILYQRQYRAVSSVYHQNRDSMDAIRSFLSSQMEILLRSDTSLMSHIESLEVSSRVKEPYSFWRKLLKTKSKQRSNKRTTSFVLAPSTEESEPSTSSTTSSRSSNLSLSQVQDGIALRIILKAKKESPDETDETTRAREKLLCYYVQHLLRKRWPALGGEKRVKDYIRNPKPNGYQSLHYTASLRYSGQQFPFEVQVRSEEMHQIAEYGVAAHWDYKLAASNETGVNPNMASEKKAAFAIEAAAEVIRSSSDADDDRAKNEAEHVQLQPTLVDAIEETLLASADDEARSSQRSSVQDAVGNTAESTGQLSYIDALVTARQSLVEERVYVFVAGTSSLTMEQGQLVMLDNGSTIRDALRIFKENSEESLCVVTEEGNVADEHGEEICAGWEPTVWKNGQQARMDEAIRSGDVLLLDIEAKPE